MNRLQLALAVSAVGLADPAVAGIINVGPGDSIQAAISGASNGDEIIVGPGTYNETIDFLGKAIIVISTDGSDLTTINGQGTGSVVTFASGEGLDSVLEGFTITGGTGTLVPAGFTFGGGVYIDHSSPTINDCVITGNTAPGGNGWGGGMANQVGSPTVTNCTFSDNTAGKNAGGIYSNGDGSAKTNAGATIDNCTFSDNTAGDNGGGMLLTNGGFSTVINCSFLANSGGGSGGGLRAAGSSGGLFATVTQCTFSGNSSNAGGGMNASKTVVTDCTFRDNTAGTVGGGLHVGNGSTVGGSTFCNNTPDHVFGVYTDAGGNLFAKTCDPLCPNPADINDSGTVNVVDLIRLLLCFGEPAVPECVSEDVNNDGNVNVLDLIELLLAFGAACP